MTILRGTVDEVADGGVYVSIPTYGDSTFGPLESVQGDTPPTYVAGDKVLVAQVSRYKEDLIVLGKIGRI